MTGGSTRGAACARWKKFHFFVGFDEVFSAFSFFDLTLDPSEEATFVRGAPSIDLEARDVRRVVKDGKNDLFESSSLSEGLREPTGFLFIGDIPRTESDMAEGSSVGFLLSEIDVVELCATFGCSLDAAISKLLLLSIGPGLLDNSALLPVPRIVTGVSLSRKKSSTSVLVALVTLLLRLDVAVRFKLSVVVPALADLPILLPLSELPLRPRTA